MATVLAYAWTVNVLHHQVQVDTVHRRDPNYSQQYIQQLMIHYGCTSTIKTCVLNQQNWLSWMSTPAFTIEIQKLFSRHQAIRI
jgi:hypothetical protein